MSSFLFVRWTVKPLTAPRPLLPCAGCGRPQSFRSSGRFRLNANGKRLDAWLLYLCTVCETTWKRPVVERQNVQRLEPAFLRALQANDAALAEAVAFDLTGLRRFAEEIAICGEVSVKREIPAKGVGSADGHPLRGASRRGAPLSSCSGLQISLSAPMVTAMRTDRLLANELFLPRARIRQMERTGRLSASTNGPYKIKRLIADQLCIRLDLSEEPDAERIRAAAAFGASAD